VDVHVDTLRLRIAGMDPGTARRFAQLAAERLGTELGASPGTPGSARLGRIQVTVPAGQAGGLAHLAGAVAAEVSRALRSADAGEAAT
jgi:hypothetical protein